MSSKCFYAGGCLAAVLTAAVCFFDGCAIVWDPNDGPDTDSTATVPKDSVPTDTSGTNPPPGPPNPALDGRLVGDWLTIYEDGYDDSIEITTLTASGKLINGGFLKVGDFWIESWETVGTWRTSNDTLYEKVIDTIAWPEVPPWSQYVIRDNKVYLRYCADKDSCDEIVSEKVSLAAVRGRLGKIQRQDTALYTSTVFPDLMWIMEDDFEFLDFDMMYFYDGERYFGYKEYYSQVWYTTGSRLFLIGMNSLGRVRETVEVEYKVTGSGIDARLYIRPFLEDGSLGPEDIWTPTQYDDSDWYWQPHLSKLSKKAVKNHKKAFTRSRWLHRVAAK